MKPIHDYLLVKELMFDDKIEGTNLSIKYDDSERFMYVEIVDVSKDIVPELSKYYPMLSAPDVRLMVSQVYVPGNKLIINRVAKTPYKDGTYFISFKDIIAFEEKEQTNLESPHGFEQLHLDM